MGIQFIAFSVPVTSVLTRPKMYYFITIQALLLTILPLVSSNYKIYKKLPVENFKVLAKDKEFSQVVEVIPTNSLIVY